MKLNLAVIALIGSLVLAGTSYAGSREDLLNKYASDAGASAPGFAGFSVARGEVMHQKKFAGGKPDTPACTSCHAGDPRAAGRTPAGKVIEPVALSVSSSRYADQAKVEKWFKRNCNEVLGRECTSLEKGDWLTYVMSR